MIESVDHIHGRGDCQMSEDTKTSSKKAPQEILTFSSKRSGGAYRSRWGKGGARRIIQVVRRKGTSWRSQKAQKICEKLSYMHKRGDEVVHNDQKKGV